MSNDRLDAIERRLDRVERVLVALASWAHGPWGPLHHRWRRPGESRSPYNNYDSVSPFEPIADLINAPKPDKPPT